jgi:hypothetical protein
VVGVFRVRRSYGDFNRWGDRRRNPPRVDQCFVRRGPVSPTACEGGLSAPAGSPG